MKHWLLIFIFAITWVEWEKALTFYAGNEIESKRFGYPKYKYFKSEMSQVFGDEKEAVEFYWELLKKPSNQKIAIWRKIK